MSALECVRHERNLEVLIKQDDATIRFELRWGIGEKEKNVFSRFHPTDADYDLIRLPHLIWPLYYPIHVMRSIWIRAFSETASIPFRPYLGTPLSLIPALLDIAELTSEDLLVDLGCGDGRILLEATKRYGCKGIGVEVDKDLAQLALDSVTAESLTDQISIRCEDFTDLALKDATIIFVFLPIQEIPSLLDKLRKQLSSGAKIIAHEQYPIDPELNPDQSIPVFTEGGITVVHIWTIE